MNWLDRAIAAISPTAGLRRVAARSRLEAMATVKRQYDAALPDRLRDGWMPTSRGPTSIITSAASMVRDRARDLVRNDSYAAKGILAWQANAIGEGIVPRARTGDPDLDKRIDDLYWEWGREADADGHGSIEALQSLACRSSLESGEVFARRRYRDGRYRRSVPVQIQLHETEYLDVSRTEGSRDGSGRRTIRGIEYNSIGQPSAYWLYPEHPGEPDALLSDRLQSRRVPASDVAHLFERTRPGQRRGISKLAPVVLSLYDIADYRQSESTRKRIESCLTAFVYDAEPGASPVEIGEKIGVQDTPDGRTGLRFSPGMINRLPPGTQVQMAEPKPSGGYREYMSVELHAVAAGFGLSYELLTGDLAEVNYTSLRYGTNEFRRYVRQYRRLSFEPMLNNRVWGWFCDEARKHHDWFPVQAVPVVWTPPKFESIDPLKDAMADLINMRMGKTSLQQIAAEEAHDWREVLQEIAEVLSLADALGVVLDSDPRKVTKTGIAHDPAALLGIDDNAKAA